MRIISRQKAIYFFLTLGVCLAAVAFAVGSGWIILNWRQGIKVFLGIIFFGAIVAGLVLNTIFLVREIRRNEKHDSFINAVTHELKTPIASIRLYLQTLQRLDVGEAQRRQFYQLMLLDTERLLHTVEQVLKAGEAAQKKSPAHRLPVEFNSLVRECMSTTMASFCPDRKAAPRMLFVGPEPRTAAGYLTTKSAGTRVPSFCVIQRGASMPESGGSIPAAAVETKFLARAVQPPLQTFAFIGWRVVEASFQLADALAQLMAAPAIALHRYRAGESRRALRLVQ